MTIHLHSAPLEALERPFWSWVSRIESQLDNKGKPMGENMHGVSLFEYEHCIWFQILNWLIYVCEYGIILCVRAFRYFCWAWTCTSSKYCEHENLWWWCVTIWIYEYTIDPCISKLRIFVCIHDLVLCSTVWGTLFERLNLNLLEDKKKFKLGVLMSPQIGLI